MNVLRASVTICNPVSGLNVYLPCCSDTLQPIICAAVYTSLMHLVHMASVVILCRLRLVGEKSVSYVEARQKEVALTRINIKEPQEKSC